MSTPMRILVTSAGAGPGTAIVKALVRRPDRAYVLATDMNPARAAGCHLADAAARVPPPDDPAFVRDVLELCRTHEIRMVVPIFDTETPVFAREAARFEERGIHVAVNPLDCVLDANDKMRSFEVCDRAGISQPARFESPDAASSEDYPLIAKPIRGVGSKGIVILKTRSSPRPEDVQEHLWQKFVAGQEFSIDTFGDPRSSLFAAVPRLRQRVRDGQMVEGVTVDDPDLVKFARAVCAAFGARDVCCLQVIRSDHGGLFFIELNPRYGTGISLSLRAGIDFPRLQWLSAFDAGSLTPDLFRHRPRVRMLRYWEEIFEELPA